MISSLEWLPYPQSPTSSTPPFTPSPLPSLRMFLISYSSGTNNRRSEANTAKHSSSPKCTQPLSTVMTIVSTSQKAHPMNEPWRQGNTSSATFLVSPARKSSAGNMIVHMKFLNNTRRGSLYWNMNCLDLLNKIHIAERNVGSQGTGWDWCSGHWSCITFCFSRIMHRFIYWIRPPSFSFQQGCNDREGCWLYTNGPIARVRYSAGSWPIEELPGLVKAQPLLLIHKLGFFFSATEISVYGITWGGTCGGIHKMLSSRWSINQWSQIRGSILSCRDLLGRCMLPNVLLCRSLSHCLHTFESIYTSVFNAIRWEILLVRRSPTLRFVIPEFPKLILPNQSVIDWFKHWIDCKKLLRTIAGVREAGVFIPRITVNIHQRKPRICSGTSNTPALNLLITPTLDQSVTEMPSNCSLQTSQIGHPRFDLVFGTAPAHPRIKFLTIVMRISKDLPCIGSILKIKKLLTLGSYLETTKTP